MLLISCEHSMSTVTSGSKTPPSGCKRSTRFSSSRWTKRDPGAPLQYKSLISEVTSNPLPRAWIELLRVVIKASEAKLFLGFESSIQRLLIGKKHSKVLRVTCSSFQFQILSRSSNKDWNFNLYFALNGKQFVFFFGVIAEIVFFLFLAVFECCCLVSQRLDFGLCELVGVCSFECNNGKENASVCVALRFPSWPVFYFLFRFLFDFFFINLNLYFLYWICELY